MPASELFNFQKHLKFKVVKGQKCIFDPIRRKYLILQPEEFVRQLFIQYLLIEKKFSINRMQVEKQFILNSLQKRFDLIIFDSIPNPRVLVEFKNSSIKLTQDVLDQITRYNLVYKVDYLVITNGIQYYSYKIDHKKARYYVMKEIPSPKKLEEDQNPVHGK